VQSHAAAEATMPDSVDRSRVYIETTIISYLTASPSRDLVQAAHQQVTRVEVGAIPRRAALDAVHIAVAVVNGMDYLLTWNCAHIANAAVRGKIEQACRDARLNPVVICTPEELMEA
jgi:hypothetical protein